MKRKIEFVMGLVFLLAAYFLADYGGRAIRNTVSVSDETKKIAIVVDAGHGGVDGGKEGIGGVLEKDINLSMALKLKEILEEKNIEVIMTRTGDEGLYDVDSNNKNIDDLKKRAKLISESGAKFAVSIHQNSYPKEEISGPQVFYHKESREGQMLADCLQQELITILKPEKEREIKADNTYYLLKKTKIPTVIVECGFLSNEKESKLLVDDEYQKNVMAAVASGIEKYLLLLQDKVV